MYNDAQMEQKWQESSIRVQEDVAKKQNSLAFKQEEVRIEVNKKSALLDLEERHAVMAAERRLARCEVVEVSENGTIHIVTKNTQVEARPRQATNFKYVGAMIYTNADNPQEKVVQLSLELNTNIGNKVLVFLDPEKCMKNGYIGKKLLTVGAVINGNSPAKKREYEQLIMAYIIRNVTKTISVPEKRGWYKIGDTINFFAGKWTWKDVKKNAK